MNTYILQTNNKQGFEWVPDCGETDIIEADSLDKALDSLLLWDTINCEIWEHLEKDVNASPKTVAELLPLKFSGSEIPATARGLTESFIVQTLQTKINALYTEMKKDVVATQNAKQLKQVAVAKLKAAAAVEAAKLGLTLEDLK